MLNFQSRLWIADFYIKIYNILLIILSKIYLLNRSFSIRYKFQLMKKYINI